MSIQFQSWTSDNEKELMEARDLLMKQKSQVMTDEYLKKCDQPSLRYLTGKGLKIREKIWKALKQ